MKTLNEMTMTLKLKRIDVCNLLMACTLISHESEAQKWRTLHDTLLQAINEFDEKNDEIIKKG